ncbi:MAG: hypothetical protein PWP08_1866 [Methanofollis sp.]|nr:hypothetical protein [Methanofollis sp.]
MRTGLFVCAVCVLLLAGAATAATPQENAARVTVTGFVVDPAVLMPGDVATVTVTVKNTADESVPLRNARMFTERNIAILDDPYQTFGAIGPGNEVSFTFTVQASSGDGIYYPPFVIDFRDAGSLRYPVTVKVEDTEPRLAIVARPDSFTAGKKETVRVTVSNPRSGEINGVSVVPSGDGIESTPTSAFIGALAPDGKAEVSFNITPSAETDLTLTVNYRNGNNQRSTSAVMPIMFSNNKKQAEILVSGIEVIRDGGIYHASGDVTNAGLEVAKAVVITAGSPAVPVDPNRVYPVASLDPDDLSNFEVTFTAENSTSVPLVIEYKDADGNNYRSTVQISIGSGAAIPETNGSFPGWAIVLIVVVIVAVGGVIVYSWKKAQQNSE